MEPVGITASLITLLQTIYASADFGYDVKRATKEREMLELELQGLSSVIQALQRRQEDSQAAGSQKLDDLFQTAGELNEKFKYSCPKNGKPCGDIALVYQTVAELDRKLCPKEQPKVWKRLAQKVSYHWDKDEFEKMLERLGRAHGRIHLLLYEADQVQHREAQSTIRRIEKRQEAAEREAEKTAIQKWLSPFSFWTRQDELCKDRCMTGDWFLKDETFQSWVLGPPRYLFCFGEAGAGKTVLSSIVVSYLQGKFKDKSIPVICIYLDHNDSINQTQKTLLGSVLKQLIQLSDFNSDAYRDATKFDKAKPPKLDDIRMLLQAEIKRYDRVFLVVDALDEYHDRQKLVSSLSQLCPEHLRLMFTSRRLDYEVQDWVADCDHCPSVHNKIYFHCKTCNLDMCQNCKNNGRNTCKELSHDLQEPYGRLIEVNIITPPEEIERYVNWYIKKELDYGIDLWDERTCKHPPNSTSLAIKVRENPEFWEGILAVMIEKAKGRILIAKLYMDSFKTKESLREIQETLGSFPKELGILYDEAMARIKASPDLGARIRGMRTLAHISCARRTLSLQELQCLLAVKPGNPNSDADAMCEKGKILESTAGLVTIDTDLKAVRLVHLSLQDYLEQKGVRQKWFSEIEADMARACLTYLDLEDLSSPSPNDEELESRKKKYPLVAYASQYWGDHVREAGANIDIENIMRLVDDYDRVAGCVQAAWYMESYCANGWDVHKGICGLHVCAWFGLSSIIPKLDKDDFEVDVEEPIFGQTPLIYACRRGHVEAAKALLEWGASVNKITLKGTTAMFEAIRENKAKIVELLLTREDLDVNAVLVQDYERTALMLAARQNHSNIVQLLLKHPKHPKIKVNAQDTYGWTALSLAAHRGHLNTTKILLGKPEIDANLVNAFGQSALMLAAERNKTEIVELLLRNGADPMLRVRQGGATAVLLAAGSNAISVIKTMMENGVDLDCLDDDSRGLLHHASAKGWPAVVRFLSELEPEWLDVNSKDMNGQTPLHDACSSSRGESTKVVEALLELPGINPAVKDNFDRSCIEVAWQHGYIKIMDILQLENKLSKRVATFVPDEQKLPLWSLAKCGFSDILHTQKLTIPSKMVSEKEPGTQSTALHWAVISNQLEILRLLLHSDASPDHQNRQGRTPLHLAAVKGNLSATQELLACHADFNNKDIWGQELLVCHADFNIKDIWGQTAFYIAQQNRHYDVALTLVEVGAAISITQVEKQRLFFAAVRSKKLTAVMILLDQGAHVLGRTPEGFTALQLAKDVDDADLIRFLRSTMESGPQMKILDPPGRRCSHIATVRQGVMKEVEQGIKEVDKKNELEEVIATVAVVKNSI